MCYSISRRDPYVTALSLAVEPVRPCFTLNDRERERERAEEREGEERLTGKL